MNCRKCGKPLPKFEKKCPECGTPVKKGWSEVLKKIFSTLAIILLCIVMLITGIEIGRTHTESLPQAPDWQSLPPSPVSPWCLFPLSLLTYPFISLNVIFPNTNAKITAIVNVISIFVSLEDFSRQRAKIANNLPSGKYWHFGRYDRGVTYFAVFLYFDVEYEEYFTYFC